MNPRQRELMQRTRQRERLAHLRAAGYKGFPFMAAYTGGKCGLCGKTIFAGSEVAYWSDRKLCHDPCITQVRLLAQNIRTRFGTHDSTPEIKAAVDRGMEKAIARLRDEFGFADVAAVV